MERQQVVGILAFILEVTDRVVARQQVEVGQGQVQALNEELAAINAKLTTKEELSESNRQLMRTNTDLDTFVYAASHDWKAPIANIEGLLGALREYPNNYLFKKVEVLPGNIGYLPFSGFVPDLAGAQPTISAALQFLSSR